MSPRRIPSSRKALTLLALAALTAVAIAGSPPMQPQPLQIGAAAPAFKLLGVDGKTYTLESFASAKLLGILFTCNHCPTAQAYEERFKKLVTDYKDKGVLIVAISTNDPKAVRLDELGYSDLGDTFEDNKLRAKLHKFNFPYLYDGDKQAAGKAYGPRATPQLYLFDVERKLRYVGRIDNSEDPKRVKTHDARNAFDALLTGKPVPAERTRVFGCSMKWASKRDSVKEFMKRLAQEPVTLDDIDAAGVKELRANPTKKLRCINIWATWCGPCVAEFPELVTIYRMYRRRPFEFISISADFPKNRTDVQAFLKKQQASNRNYLYTGEDRDALAKALDEKWTGAFPLTVLVEPGGKIVYRHEGQIDPMELRRAILAFTGRYYHK